MPPAPEAVFSGAFFAVPAVSAAFPDSVSRDGFPAAVIPGHSMILCHALHLVSRLFGSGRPVGCLLRETRKPEGFLDFPAAACQLKDLFRAHRPERRFLFFPGRILCLEFVQFPLEFFTHINRLRHSFPSFFRFRKGSFPFRSLTVYLPGCCVFSSSGARRKFTARKTAGMKENPGSARA